MKTSKETLKKQYSKGWDDPFNTASWINWDAVADAIDNGTLPGFLMED